jgi:hypothetical protein
MVNKKTIILIFIAIIFILFTILLVYIYIKKIECKYYPIMNKKWCNCVDSSSCETLSLEKYSPPATGNFPIDKNWSFESSMGVANYSIHILSNLSNFAAGKQKDISVPLESTDMKIFETPKHKKACLTLKTKDAFWIFFRGTLTPSELFITDKDNKQIIKKDLQLKINNNELVNDKESIVFGGKDIKVHRGDWNYYETIAKCQVRKEAENAMKDPNIKGVYVCGHSLGGAISLICGLDLANRGIPVAIMAFGTPKAGNVAFARAVQSISNGCVLVLNTDDSIPTNAGPNPVESNSQCNKLNIFSNPENLWNFTINKGSWILNHQTQTYSEGLIKIEEKQKS